MKNLSLTYCTNVHPIGDWHSWRNLLAGFGSKIRLDLGWKNLPLGLWFPSALVAELEKDPDTNARLIQELFLDHGLSAFTCNAFPFGNFHDKVVKTKVYHPDWTQPERLDYTLACARILAAVIPKGSPGSLSTLPLGWRVGWSENMFQASARNLIAYIKSARDLADKNDRQIQLAIEPEPGCALETVDQVVDFWDRHLRPTAKMAGISFDDLNTYCGLCYDTCHQAVQFENPIEVLDTLYDQGIPIAKMQLSSALEFKADPARVSESLRHQFIEERFLHQTKVKVNAKVKGGKEIISFDDLPQALVSASASDSDSESIQDLWHHPWRVHFHVPIDARELLDSKWVSTTQQDMLQAFSHAVENNRCHHFEVETYTWSVLPETHRPKNEQELSASIARELRFISGKIPPGILLNGDATDIDRGNGIVPQS